MKHKASVPSYFRRTSLCLALGFCLMSHAAWAGGEKGVSHPEVPGRALFEVGAAGESFDSFIVYYRGDAEPGDDESKAAQDTRAMLQKDLDRVSARLSLKAMHERRIGTGGHLLRLSRALDKRASTDFMVEMAANPDVEVIEPNATHYVQIRPNDARYSQQWGLHGLAGGINVESAWDNSMGNNVVIAIIDSGQTSHPDLDAKTLPGYDLISDPASARDGNGRDSDPTDNGTWAGVGECGEGSPAQDSSWHGMHVAGIAGAITNNGSGIAGTAPGAKIQHVRVMGKCGSGSTADITDGIIWASGGRVSGVPRNPTPARVLNLSLGGPGACSTTYQRAINSARSRKSVVVVAAGNSSAPVATFSPANCNGVIAVAANNLGGRRAGYSNFGPEMDISAPGGEGRGAESILSTVNTGTSRPMSPSYGGMSGTSMAAPFVSGVAALMLERRPSLTPNQIETIIRNTARPFPSDCTGGCGTGILDASEAVRVARGGSISRYTVSVALHGNGSGKVTSSPSGINCGGSCSKRFNKNATVTLRATPDSGYEFAGWAGSCTGTSRTCRLTMREAKNAQALFKIPVTTLNNGSVRNNLSAINGRTLMYKISVPAGASNLRIQTSGGLGDADLYVQHGSEPTAESYICRPYLLGNNESCVRESPLAGDYYIALVGDPGFSGVRLSARYTAGTRGGPLLARNSPKRNINVAEGDARYYRFSVPSGASNLRISLQDGQGQAILLVRRGNVPDATKFDCVATPGDAQQICRSTNPAAGTHYIMIYGYSRVSGLTLRGTYTRGSSASTAEAAGEDEEVIWFDVDDEGHPED